MASATPRIMKQQSKTGPLELAGRCRGEPLVLDGIRSDLCAGLEHVILGRMERTRRSHASVNVRGWKSGEDFFAWPEVVVQELRKAIIGQLGTSASLVAWAMVNRAGSEHPRHQHRIALLSGIYFVTSGNDDAITPTIFECPSDVRVREGRYELEVEPHPGRLVICRGETWHRVPPYLGELPRITVAFDVRR